MSKIYITQPIKTFTTTAQHYWVALSGSSLLQTCLEARIVSVGMLTATVSDQWTYVLPHEQAKATLTWERALRLEGVCLEYGKKALHQ